MGSIKGYVEVELEKATGDKNTITVDGSQFGLEEGGDWSRYPDDGKLYAGFLFIAFCDGFDLVLSTSIHGNVFTHYNLSLREAEYEEFEIETASITQDELDLTNLFPNQVEDID
ncbi:hypothetical protein [Aliidiomarina quisquiliarum]|uniref:hypothetical protein n=1 Tax=Aliidiomarina quisquiliarum TaxID=2938947 RepID=UPI00208F04E2|nr:hypothetical protein [Aliidiomarina quisquiliarum]MCO4320687.1 hypothetical protein [Aliidiomarina quisquiliarum]